MPYELPKSARVLDDPEEELESSYQLPKSAKVVESYELPKSATPVPDDEDWTDTARRYLAGPGQFVAGLPRTVARALEAKLAKPVDPRFERPPILTEGGKKFLASYGLPTSRKEAAQRLGEFAKEQKVSQEETFKQFAPRNLPEELSQAVGSGVMSLAAAVGLTYATGSPQAAAVAFGVLAKGDTYEQAIAAGVSPELADQLSDWRGLGEGALEGIGLGYFMKRFSTPLRGIVIRSLSESLQEASQSGWEALIEKGSFDPNRSWEEIFKDIGMSAFVGALTGGPGGAMVQLQQSREMNEILSRMGVDPKSPEAQEIRASLVQKLNDDTAVTVEQAVGEVQADRAEQEAPEQTFELPESAVVLEEAPVVESQIETAPVTPDVAPGATQAVEAATEAVAPPAVPVAPAEGVKAKEYSMAGDVVDGREVLEDVPNEASIASSLEEYEELPGIREVPMSDFELTGKQYSVQGNERIRELQGEIKASGKISPLIVVIDNEGPYILEGATRADALYNLGAKSFPAKVVMDLSEQEAIEAQPAATEEAPGAMEEARGPWRKKVGPYKGAQKAELAPVTAEQVKAAQEGVLAAPLVETPIQKVRRQRGEAKAKIQEIRKAGQDVAKARAYLLDYAKQNLPASKLAAVNAAIAKASEKGLQRIATRIDKMAFAEAAEVTEEKVLTAGDVLKYALKKAETVSRKAYIAGERAQIATGEELAAYAESMIPNEDYKKIEKAVRKARTPSEIRKATDAIEILAERIDRRDALKEYDKVIKKLKKTKVRPEFQKRFDAILEENPRKVTADKALKRINSLLEYSDLVETKEGLEEAIGMSAEKDLALPQALVNAGKETLARAGKNPLSKMDSDSIRRVTASILAIKKMNDLKQGLIALKGHKTLEAAVEQAAKEAGGLDENYDRRTRKSEGGGWIRRWLKIGQFNLSTKAEILGGREGVLYEALVTNFNKGDAVAEQIVKDGYLAIEDALEKHTEVGWDEETRKIKLPDAGSLEVSHGQMINLINMIGDPSTRREMMKNKQRGIHLGNWGDNEEVKLTAADMTAIQEQALPSEKEIAAEAKAFVNSDAFREQIQDAYVRMYGTPLNLHDNYWTRSRARYGVRGEADITINDFLNQHLKNVSAIQERQDSNKAFNVENGLLVYYRHLTQMGAFIGKSEAVRDAKRLLRHPKFQDAVMQNFGKNAVTYLKNIEDAVSTYEGATMNKINEFDRSYQRLIRTAQRGVLTFKPIIMAYQGVSLTNVMTEVDQQDFWKGFFTSRKGVRKEMADNCSMMWFRNRATGHSIITPYMNEKTKDMLFWGRERSTVGNLGNKGLAGIRGVDMAVMDTTWLIIKAEGKRTHGLSGDALLEYADVRMREIVSRTQPSSNVISMSHLALQSKNSSAAMLVTLFSNQISTNLNLMASHVVEYRRIPKAERTWEDRKKLLRGILIPSIVGALMVTAIRNLVLWAYSGFKKEFFPKTDDLTFEFVSRLFSPWLIVRTGVDIMIGWTRRAVKKSKGEHVWDTSGFTTLGGRMLEDVVGTGDAVIDYAIEKIKDEDEEKEQEKMWKAIDKGLQAGGYIVPGPQGILQVTRQHYPWVRERKMREWEKRQEDEE